MSGLTPKHQPLKFDGTLSKHVTRQTLSTLRAMWLPSTRQSMLFGWSCYTSNITLQEMRWITSLVRGGDMHFSRGCSRPIWLAAGLGIASAWSQTVSAPDMAFDVASIKPARPDARGYSIRPFPGRLSAENVTLKLLIAEACHVYDFQISGPKWIDSERYDLEAKIDGALPASKAQLRSMLQRLLADRFGLSVRRESKEM